jgi:hypothetical protein
MAASPGTTGVDVTVSQAICEQTSVLQSAVKQGGEALCRVASVKSVEYDVADPFHRFSGDLEALCTLQTLNIPYSARVTDPQIEVILKSHFQGPRVT